MNYSIPCPAHFPTYFFLHNVARQSKQRSGEIGQSLLCAFKILPAPPTASNIVSNWVLNFFPEGTSVVFYTVFFPIVFRLPSAGHWILCCLHFSSWMHSCLNASRPLRSVDDLAARLKDLLRAYYDYAPLVFRWRTRQTCVSGSWDKPGRSEEFWGGFVRDKTNPPPGTNTINASINVEDFFISALAANWVVRIWRIFVSFGKVRGSVLAPLAVSTHGECEAPPGAEFVRCRSAPFQADDRLKTAGCRKAKRLLVRLFGTPDGTQSQEFRKTAWKRLTLHPSSNLQQNWTCFRNWDNLIRQVERPGVVSNQVRHLRRV